MKKYLLILHQNPYKNSLALEALEFALALSSFEQPVSLLFKGESIRQLLLKQEPEQLVCKDFTKIYTDLKLFGIENIYVEQTMASQHIDSEFIVFPKVLNVE